jgi:hypothetical protein
MAASPIPAHFTGVWDNRKAAQLCARRTTRPLRGLPPRSRPAAWNHRSAMLRRLRHPACCQDFLDWMIRLRRCHLHRRRRQDLRQRRLRRLWHLTHCYLRSRCHLQMRLRRRRRRQHLRQGRHCRHCRRCILCCRLSRQLCHQHLQSWCPLQRHCHLWPLPLMRRGSDCHRLPRLLQRRSLRRCRQRQP